jgi:SAM-dependent methyltransferase
MIDKRDEYERMFRVEEQLWWYRILHETVGRTLQKQFGNRRDIRVLDAGCGTGGLLTYLRGQGYLNLRGLDGSPDGVAFCHQRGLSVSLLDLNELADFEPDAAPYDAIVCNDVFCYFNDPALRQLLTQLARRLRPGGLLISNNNAFAVFRGQHDLAVGSTRRFVRADFDRLAPAAGLRIRHSTYWSLFLSPLILAVRGWQSWQLRNGQASAEAPASDVYLPPAPLNAAFYQLVRLEQWLMPRSPFGSSIFLVMQP